MYVCICQAVSDKEIKDAVADGAEDLESIQHRLGAATGCGTCAEFTQKIINDTLAQGLTYAA